APETTHEITGTAGTPPWYISDVELKLTATDPEPASGVNKIQWRYVGYDWTDVTGATATIPLTSEGTFVIEYRAVDNAGIEEAVKNVTIRIDKTAPTIENPLPTPGSYVTTTARPTISVTVSDNVSGISVYKMYVMGSPVAATLVGSTLSYTPATDLAEGAISVKVEVKDYAGIVETLEWSFTIEIPLPPQPEGTMVINDDAPYTNTLTVTLTLNVTNAIEMCFSNDGIIYSPWEAYNATKVWTLTAGDAPKTVYAQLRNVARGKESKLTISDTIMLDATEPTVSIFGGDRAVSYRERQVALTAIVSEDVTYLWTIEGITYNTSSVTHTFTEAGTYIVTLTVTDKAGNEATTTVTITVRPKPVPPFIPGFEALAVIAALGTVALIAALLRKKKKL
ncbi:MAG: PKD domain-containing protein, partial [Candidatus Thermoplasmatota archaeon]|nr:PKD domain-containing protein [Candidatus Thermoplasmatota archaeon]